MRIAVAIVVLALATPALADRGALTVDAGGGMTGLLVAAPYATGASPLRSAAPTARLGARYALTNSIEFSSSAFFEPPVTLFHNGVLVETENGSFPGTLTHSLYRYGALGGGRYVRGSVWRFTFGFEAGWSHRAYSGFQHVDDSNPENASDYRLALADFTTDNLVLASLAGIEWTVGDHWSMSLLPRAELLLGPDATFAITVPLVVSWSFYL